MAARLTSAERAHYREHGWVAPAVSLPEALLTPLKALIRGLGQQKPRQELLSGIHNPFGHHACPSEAWKFLDIAESALLLDPVEDVLGPDIVLWDSELYLYPARFAAEEAQYWPVEPLAGMLAIIAVEHGSLLLADITRLKSSAPFLPTDGGPRYVSRYMPATSHFNRDPRFPPTRLAMEARPLVNYIKRPIWLMRGEDHGDNDFVTGFSMPAARWAGGLG